MASRLALLILLSTVSFSAVSLPAQVDNQSIAQRVAIRIVPPNGAACDASLRFILTGNSGPPRTGSPNNDCEIVLFNVPVGVYHLSVSGARSNLFEGALQFNSTMLQEVRIEINPPAERITDVMSSSGIVSTSELSVPSRARKEFLRAYALLEKQDFTNAVLRFNKAIALYPGYARAYNNLAVAYAHLGDRVNEAEFLQKAISIDDRLVPAYLNLGRLDIASGKFPDAEAALARASTIDPTDPLALVLLAYAEYIDHRFDAAIATSRQAHALDKPHAVAHRIAAGAFEQKNEGTKAIAELELFLKEEPAGPRADAARQEMEKIKGIVERVAVNRGASALAP
jgi:tetratricopeptide (TPR) repeat protein